MKSIVRGRSKLREHGLRNDLIDIFAKSSQKEILVPSIEHYASWYTRLNKNVVESSEIV